MKWAATQNRAGTEAIAGCGVGLEREVGFFFFFFSISFLKQANKFEFKPGFESKHPKTMHRHECNTHNYLFNLEIQTKDFSYTIFPVKKNKSWAKF
jgi:hypothetical protein